MLQTLREFIEEKSIAIDRDVFTQLWNIIEGPDWVPLSREFIKEHLTNEKGVDAVTNFNRRMITRSNYVLNVDYKQTDPPVGQKFANGTKFYAVTKKTFVSLLCKAKTPTSLRYLEHFYEIQNLVVQYYKSQVPDTEKSLAELMETATIAEHTEKQREKYAELESKELIGHVYFIHEDCDFTCFKIGYSQDVDARMISLQTGNKNTLKCYKVVKSEDMKADEAYFHEVFANSHVRGEWFAISPEEIDDAINRWSEL